LTTASKRTLLLDGDIFAYQICASVEREIEWEEDLWVLYSNASECKQHLDSQVLRLKTDLEAHDIVIAFSSSTNFRKDIYPEYKSNRKGSRKPLAYRALVNYAKETYRTMTLPWAEADDVLGILATGHRIRGDRVVVSIDKDLESIPCKLFNPNKLALGVRTVTKEEADYNHLLQTLTGDRTDGYPGCPTYGDKRSRILLDEGVSWKAVVGAYEKQGLSEEVALAQAQIARICRAKDYDMKNKKVIPWTPTK
jgi:DNA polymerase-1